MTVRFDDIDRSGHQAYRDDRIFVQRLHLLAHGDGGRDRVDSALSRDVSYDLRVRINDLGILRSEHRVTRAPALIHLCADPEDSFIHAESLRAVERVFADSSARYAPWRRHQRPTAASRACTALSASDAAKRPVDPWLRSTSYRPSDLPNAIRLCSSNWAARFLCQSASV